MALVALTATLPLAAAHAADQPVGHIVDTKPTDAGLDFVLTANPLPENTSLDPQTVTVRVQHQGVAAVAEPVTDKTKSTPIQRTAVLVIDVSTSMQNKGPDGTSGIDGAKQAAYAFLDSVPPDVSVGLLTFGSTVTQLTPPITDRGVVRGLISGLQANGDTVLYDGLLTALQAAGTSGIRSVILLTDGQDAKSNATKEQALVAAQAAKIPVDAVATGKADGATLQEIATSSKGNFVAAADAPALTKAFQSTARTIANQLAIHVPIPPELAGKSGLVEVSAKVGGIPVSDSVVTFLGGTPAASPSANPLAPYGPKAVPAASGILVQAAPLLPYALVAVFIGVAVLLAFAFASAIPASASSGGIRRRLSVYTLTGNLPVKESEEVSSATALGNSTVARSAVELAGRVVRKRDFEEVLGTKLEGAGVPLKPAEWLIVHVGAALGLSLLMLLLFSGRLVAAAIGLFVGVMLPLTYLDRKESKRRNAFLAALPDTLQLLAGSLSAGYSLPQAADSVVREGHEPMAGEFNRALIETRLGVPLEDALEGIATRLSSDDFRWVVMAIKIQREVGGNLAELLTTVAATLRERERLRRQVQVLSAEGRLSAWILGLLPIAFAAYLILARPQYIRPLYTQPLGWGMIFVGLVLLITGVLWLRRTVRVEV